MNTTQSPNFSSVLIKAAVFGLQWRLLTLWMFILLIPTVLVIFPFWQMLSSQLNHSVYSQTLAQQLSMSAMDDIFSVMSMNKVLLQDVSMGAILITMLLSPFLTGTVVTAARAQSPLTMAKLVHGGISEYWRLFRMLVWACIPLGIAGGVGALAMHFANGYADKAVFQSNAELAGNAAWAVLIFLVVIADASVDAGRAQFIHSTNRRSAIKAWWKGFVMVVKHPLITLGFYLVLTLAGLLLVGLFGLLRINLGHIQTPGFILGTILTQLTVASIVWMKCARLYALGTVAK